MNGKTIKALRETVSNHYCLFLFVLLGLLFQFLILFFFFICPNAAPSRVPPRATGPPPPPRGYAREVNWYSQTQNKTLNPIHYFNAIISFNGSTR